MPLWCRLCSRRPYSLETKKARRSRGDANLGESNRRPRSGRPSKELSTRRRTGSGRRARWCEFSKTILAGSSLAILVRSRRRPGKPSESMWGSRSADAWRLAYKVNALTRGPPSHAAAMARTGPRMNTPERKGHRSPSEVLDSKKCNPKIVHGTFPKRKWKSGKVKTRANQCEIVF